MPGMNGDGIVFDPVTAGIQQKVITTTHETDSDVVSALMAWWAYIWNGVATIGLVANRGIRGVTAAMKEATYESMLSLYAREHEMLGIPASMTPDELYGLGLMCDESQRHPLPPPIYDPAVSRIAMFGDTFLWFGHATFADKGHMTEVIPWLKAQHF